MAHHQWLIDAKCPKCGAYGKVKVFEDAGPPFQDVPRRKYQPSREWGGGV